MIKLNDSVLVKEYIYEREKVSVNDKKEKLSFFDKIKNFFGIS